MSRAKAGACFRYETDKIAVPTGFAFFFWIFPRLHLERALISCPWRRPSGSVHTHLTLVIQGRKDIFSFLRIPPLPHKVCVPGSWWWFRVVYLRSLKHLLFSTRWSWEEKCLRTWLNTSSSPASNTADVYKTTVMAPEQSWDTQWRPWRASGFCKVARGSASRCGLIAAFMPPFFITAYCFDPVPLFNDP